MNRPAKRAPDLPAGSRRRRRSRTLLASLIAAGLFAGVVGAEVVARAVARARGSPWDPAAARQLVLDVRERLWKRDWRPPEDQRASASAGDPVLHPYVGWDSRPAIEGHSRLARESRAARAAGVLEVGVFGGSVSCQFVAEAAQRLASALRADPRLAHRRISVRSMGQGAHKQPQQVMALEWAFAAGFEFDVVVNIDGFNEVAIANQNATNGAFPLQPSFAQYLSLLSDHARTAESDTLMAHAWLERERADGAMDAILTGRALDSAVLGPVAIARARRAYRDYLDAHLAMVAALGRALEDDVSLRGPPPPGRFEDVLEIALHAWKESSVSMAALCRRRGIRYLHVLQPTLHDAGSKPLTAGEIEVGRAPDSWVQGVVRGYPRMREAAGELRRRGVDFLDASRLFAAIESPLYFDACHFRKPGNERLADAIAEAVLGSLP